MRMNRESDVWKFIAALPRSFSIHKTSTSIGQLDQWSHVFWKETWRLQKAFVVVLLSAACKRGKLEANWVDAESLVSNMEGSERKVWITNCCWKYVGIPTLHVRGCMSREIFCTEDYLINPKQLCTILQRNVALSTILSSLYMMLKFSCTRNLFDWLCVRWVFAI